MTRTVAADGEKATLHSSRDFETSFLEMKKRCEVIESRPVE
jgi:hypothetical protein